MSIRGRYGIIFLMLILQMCSDQSSNAVKHNYGDTTRAILGNYTSCTEDGLFPEVRAYIFDLLSLLTTANHDVFTGELAVENICINIVHKNSINASMHARSRTLTVNTGTITAFSSDAEVVAVIAHELAHLSRSHNSTGTHDDFTPTKNSRAILDGFRPLNIEYRNIHMDIEYYIKAINVEIALNGAGQAEFDAFKLFLVNLSDPRAYDAMIGNPSSELRVKHAELKSALAASDQTLLGGHLFDFMETYRRNYVILAQFRQTISEYRDEMSLQVGIDAYNWQEIEADDVGLQFYLKTGLSLEQYLNIYEELALRRLQRAGDSETALGDCQLYGIAYEDKEQLLIDFKNEIKQGTATHPAWCWRILHNFYEIKKHIDHYQPTMSGDGINFSSLRSQALVSLSSAEDVK